MKKIDTQQYERFMQATECLISDLNKWHEKQMARELKRATDELDRVYQTYTQLVEQLESNIGLYCKTFDKTLACYREILKQKNKKKTKNSRISKKE